MAQQPINQNPTQFPDEFQLILTSLIENKEEKAIELFNKSKFSLDINRAEQSKDNITLLHIASQNGYLNFVRLLIEAKANLDVRADHEITPLHLASQNGHLEIVELLDKNGADIDAETNFHATPIHVAASMGQFEVVKYLYERGADIEVITKLKGESLSVSDVAEKYHYPEIEQYLKNAFAAEIETKNMRPF